MDKLSEYRKRREARELLFQKYKVSIEKWKDSARTLRKAQTRYNAAKKRMDDYRELLRRPAEGAEQHG